MSTIVANILRQKLIEFLEKMPDELLMSAATDVMTHGRITDEVRVNANEWLNKDKDV
ncbi:MAG: hypothetical protein WC753_04655 [Candidatus Gracilibacteria bacterium]|jgi:hypothetical protein